MKIAFFVHCFFPDHFYGTETYTFDLARHYQAWGHEVTVVSAVFQGEPGAADLITRYRYQGIPVVCIDKNRMPHSRVKETYYQPDMRPVLEKVLRELRPDVVHVTHLINHTAVLLEVTQQLGIPTFATFTDFFGFCFNNKLEAADGSLCPGPMGGRTRCLSCYIRDGARSPNAEPWMRWAIGPASARWLARGVNLARSFPPLRGGPIDGLVEDLCRRPEILSGLYNSGYTAAIAPSRFLHQAYEHNGILVPMRNIWFGVDIDRCPKPDRPRGHKPVIGFIGQIAPHKGTDLLLEAFRRLPRDAAKLQIYGPADQDPAYMANLKSLSAGCAVQFMGTFPKEQMAAVLRELDLLVIPSRWYENSPLVLLNALASHTPVIVSDVAGMTEFIRPGFNGRAFALGCVDDLHSALFESVRDGDYLKTLSSTTSFDRRTETMAEETLNSYERM